MSNRHTNEALSWNSYYDFGVKKATKLDNTEEVHKDLGKITVLLGISWYEFKKWKMIFGPSFGPLNLRFLEYDLGQINNLLGPRFRSLKSAKKHLSPKSSLSHKFINGFGGGGG